MNAFTVGQELWFEPSERRRREQPDDKGCYLVRVVKVGRRWVKLSRGGDRMDVNTMEVDGGAYQSPGRCWPSKKAWQAEEARQDAWRELRDHVARQWRPPEWLPTEDIVRALAIVRDGARRDEIAGREQRKGHTP